jgi:hypothetical protein
MIIDEYNNLYSKETKGLSLSTNSALYTNTVIKLENLRDTLYHNFEKNVDYYDILDLIAIPLLLSVYNFHIASDSTLF